MSVQYLPTTGVDEKTHRLLIAETINQMLKGRSNNVGSLTLTPSTTTTTVTDNLFDSNMVPVLIPTSANAAGALSGLYLSARANGSFTLTHASTAAADKTFLYIRVG